MFPTQPYFLFFFFNDTATTEIYTLSLHDALPISHYKRPALRLASRLSDYRPRGERASGAHRLRPGDRRARLRRDERSEEHTSELQSQSNLVCRLLLEKKKKKKNNNALNKTQTKHN